MTILKIIYHFIIINELINKVHLETKFIFPEVTLKAYDPQGFIASIPDIKGIQLFAFHANINKEVSELEPGEYNTDIIKPQNNAWTYFNPDITLKVGDKVYYRIFLQFEKLGYRKDNIEWIVKELIDQLEDTNTSCVKSETEVSSGNTNKICVGSIIFEENFSGSSINNSNWIIEHYIPFSSPDYEFVSYQNNQNSCFVNDDKLFIIPQMARDEAQVNGELNLKQGCTRNADFECYYRREGIFIIPPVTSAKIVSTLHFRYGEIEIKAKLPAGDWIYPQIYLEGISNSKHKLLIAYARGNDRLLGADNYSDIGSRLLFAGPILDVKEPQKSLYLSSKHSVKSFCNDIHIYKIIWTKNRISLFVDGEQFGEVPEIVVSKIMFAQNDFVRLVLGVGVGGVNDFPDNYRSGDYQKPWKNKDRAQLKNFFASKNQWINTWDGNNCALQVDYVKIKAL